MTVGVCCCGDGADSVDVGSFRMSRLCERGWLGLLLQEPSADPQVCRDPRNGWFHAEEDGIQVFCVWFGVRSKEISLKQPSGSNSAFLDCIDISL